MAHHDQGSSRLRLLRGHPVIGSLALAGLLALPLAQSARASSPAPLSVLTASLPFATQSQHYNTTLKAGGGTAPFTWRLSSSALPRALVLNAASGAISGTPAYPGFSQFTVTVADGTGQKASKTLALKIKPAPWPKTLTIVTTSLPPATKGVPYSAPIQANGGSPPFVWALTAGALPHGMDVAVPNGTISGTPGVSGSFTFRVTDNDNAGGVASQYFTLVVH
jgi:hypothetical protein